jgi:hypothetical protein
MSKLLQLTIVGSLNPCSQTVKLQNQNIGATVTISVKPKAGGAAFVAGGGAAMWPDQDFPIPSLKKDDVLTAVQSQAGFTTSNPASTTVLAGPSVADLSKGSFASPLYICSKCVYLYGCFPAAFLRVESNGQPLGKGVVSGSGEAFINLTRELNGTDHLRAIADCGSTPGAPILASGVPIAPPPLTAPTVEQAIECDQAIGVSGIVPGAQVTVSRGGHAVGTFCVPTGRLIVSPVKPLKLPTDNPIAATQAFPHDLCRSTSPQGSSTLLKADQIKPPKIKEPLCQGDTSIVLSELRRGATVELTVNGDTIVFGAADLSKSIPVGPLTFPQTVTARQNTCGDPGSWSQLRKAVVNTAAPVAPKLNTPVNNATKVSLTPTLSFADLGAYCNRANSLDVQIATNAGFTTQLQKTTVGGSTNFWIPSKLKVSTTYFWRVRANHSGQPSSAWSTFKFTTAADDSGGHPPPPPPGNQDFCFTEDCCPYFRRVIVVNAPTQADAMAKAIAQSPGCSITPIDCGSKVPGCSDP